jgi:hypothetical protein
VTQKVKAAGNDTLAGRSAVRNEGDVITLMEGDDLAGFKLRFWLVQFILCRLGNGGKAWGVVPCRPCTGPLLLHLITVQTVLLTGAERYFICQRGFPQHHMEGRRQALESQQHPLSVQWGIDPIGGALERQ